MKLPTFIVCMMLGFCQSINYPQVAKDPFHNIPYVEISYSWEW